ncbi:PREDICTED: CCAAT/enhancer-binding protein gamma-like [Priapulus caudatus]|uniref:CCAAT/enhancer-binding protein gamma-like n=1 Tax=Priapulus caudatus TaxID=37621 RepID=A0ABM1E0P8_PRICU|nr:PREDICTED: CCAAT/enhancer-binding protein gamma-like [Priapulus caudatus]
MTAHKSKAHKRSWKAAGHVDRTYRVKRDRNNDAVKRSRAKAQQKQQATLERVQQLREENRSLEDRVRLLAKELSVLKEILVRGVTGNMSEVVVHLDDGDVVDDDDDDKAHAGFCNDHMYMTLPGKEL